MILMLPITLLTIKYINKLASEIRDYMAIFSHVSNKLGILPEFQTQENTWCGDIKKCLRKGRIDTGFCLPLRSKQKPMRISIAQIEPVIKKPLLLMFDH